MKYLFLASALAVSTVSFAQKNKVSDAQRAYNSAAALGSQDEARKLIFMQQAIESIDAASVNDATKDDPKTWFLKSKIYFEALGIQSFASEERLLEANKALNKAIDMNKDLVMGDKTYPNVAAYAAFQNNNAGIEEYNNENYLVAREYFGNIVKYLGATEDPKITKVYPYADTLRLQGMFYEGKSMVNEENYEEGAELMKRALGKKSINQEEVIESLIYAYDKAGNAAKKLAMIEDGRKLFPKNQNFVNYEINYYIETKQQDKMAEKVEAAMKQDPTNPTHPFNLGILYANMAAPVDGYLPENAATYEKKAEENLLKALELSKEDPSYNQMLGIHYYNSAVDAHNRARNLNQGNEKDKALGTQMLTKRDIYYKKALPILERTAELYEKKGSKLKGEEKKQYIDTLEALKKIYATQNLPKKFNEMQTKINNVE